MALQIMERREDFPGDGRAHRGPRVPAAAGANAAHELGYLGPVTDEELREVANDKRGAKNETCCRAPT